VCLAAALLAWRGLRPAESPASKSEPDSVERPLLTVLVGTAAGPVIGAEVALSGPDCRQHLLTDEEGYARISDCPPGQVTMTVELSGYARQQRSVVLSPEGNFQQIDMFPAARLAGQVLDDAGRPMAAVMLIVRTLGAALAGPAPQPWTALSARDGRFGFDTLPHGSVALEARCGSDHEPVSLAEIVLPNERVEIKLRRTAAVSGSVTTADGEPAALANVTLAGSGVWPARVAQTGPTGEFEFLGLPEGIYEVRAELGSQVSAPLEGVQVQAGARVRFAVVLAPGSVIRGHVRAAVSGRPLAGASLELAEESLSASVRRTRAAADGSFELVGLRSVPHRVTVRQPGYVTQQRWLKPGGSARIELLRAAAISGKVEDSDGRPVALADLEIRGRSLTGDDVHMVGPVQEAPALDPTLLSPGTSGDNLGVTNGGVPRLPLLTLPDGAAGASVGFHTDEQGRFQLSGLPPGQLVVIAHKPRVGSARSAPLTLRPGSTLEDVTIALPRGHTLRGYVRDGHGAPIAHVRVDLECAADPTRSITTEADGGFAFESVRGECALWVRPLGTAPKKLAGSAQELARAEHVITLERGTERVFGRVLSTRGEALESASVRLRVLQAHGFAPLVLTESDGSFEFSALPPPPYTLDVEHPEYLAVHALPVASTREPLVIRLEAGTELSGEVRNAQDDAPIAGAEVRYRSGASAFVARTSRDGGFTFRHVPLGVYEVSVTAERFIPRVHGGRLEGGSALSLPLQLELQPEASISGDVVDALGRTVWNAQVAVGSPPDWEHAVRTDHAGHFELRGVMPGEHALSARHGQIVADRVTSARAVAGERSSGSVLRLPQIVDDEGAAAAEASAEASASEARREPLGLARRGATVVVERVTAGSTAARAGLQVGDVLLSVNGEPVRSAAQARGMLRPIAAHGPAASLNLEIRRDRSVLRLRYAPDR